MTYSVWFPPQPSHPHGYKQSQTPHKGSHKPTDHSEPQTSESGQILSSLPCGAIPVPHPRNGTHAGNSSKQENTTMSSNAHLDTGHQASPSVKAMCNMRAALGYHSQGHRYKPKDLNTRSKPEPGSNRFPSAPLQPLAGETPNPLEPPNNSQVRSLTGAPAHCGQKRHELLEASVLGSWGRDAETRTE